MSRGGWARDSDGNDEPLRQLRSNAARRNPMNSILRRAAQGAAHGRDSPISSDEAAAQALAVVAGDNPMGMGAGVDLSNPGDDSLIDHPALGQEEVLQHENQGAAAVVETPVGLPSAQHVHMVCGAGQPPSECFFCTRVGEAKGAPMYVSELKKMIQYIQDNRVNTPVIVLASQLLVMYNKWRQSAIQIFGDNEHNPLPEQELGTFVAHLNGDHQNLSSSLWLPLRIQQLAEVVNKLFKESVFLRDEATGQDRPSKDTCAILERYMKLEMMYRKTNPEKLAFGDKGIQINPNTAGQIVSTHGKRLLNDLRRNQ